MFDLNLDRAKADAQPCAQSGNHCAQIGIFARFFNPRWPPCPQSLYSLAAQDMIWSSFFNDLFFCST